MSKPWHESEFRSEIVASIHNHGFHLIDIKDELKSVLGLLPLETQKLLASRISLKPYDLAFLCNGTYYALELKVETDSFTVNLKQLVEDHQFKALREVFQQGGRAGVLVRCKRGLTAPQRHKLGSLVDQGSWSLDLTYFLDYAIIDRNKMSWTLDDLEEKAIRIKKKDGFYDLCPILRKKK